MKILKVIIQVIILYVFSMLGNLLQTIFHLPISGSIIGLFLLLAALMLKIIPVPAIKQGSEFLLLFLTLFFVPATIGIMNYPALFSSSGSACCYCCCSQHRYHNDYCWKNKSAY